MKDRVGKEHTEQRKGYLYVHYTIPCTKRLTCFSCRLKETVLRTRFFDSGFFHESSSPQAPKNNIRGISKFFENSQVRCPKKDFFHLPPVSTIPVVHLELVISPRILEKILNDPNGRLRGWRETDS